MIKRIAKIVPIKHVSIFGEIDIILYDSCSCCGSAKILEMYIRDNTNTDEDLMNLLAVNKVEDVIISDELGTRFDFIKVAYNSRR